MSNRYSRIARFKDQAFKYLGLFSTFFGLLMLTIFISSIFSEGIGRIDWDFITNFPSRNPAKAGILSALAGTMWIIVITALVAMLTTIDGIEHSVNESLSSLGVNTFDINSKTNRNRNQQGFG